MITSMEINWFNSEKYFFHWWISEKYCFTAKSVTRQITDSISENLTDPDLEIALKYLKILFKWKKTESPYLNL